MTSSLRVLTVCTHNQTRSVIMAALLRRDLAAAGVDARVLSVGVDVRSGGAPATERAVRLLADRGLDLSGHRSTRADDAHVRHADLIVCAEHAHVVSIAGGREGVFERCFTLPEIVRLGERVGPRAGAPLEGWLAELAAERPQPLDYLTAPSTSVGELSDPTGLSPATWRAAVDEIEDLAGRLAELLR